MYGKVSHRISLLIYNKGWSNTRTHMSLGCKLSYMIILITFETHISRSGRVKPLQSTGY